jgi:hypothetical protein
MAMLKVTLMLAVGVYGQIPAGFGIRPIRFVIKMNEKIVA